MYQLEPSYSVTTITVILVVYYLAKFHIRPFPSLPLCVCGSVCVSLAGKVKQNVLNILLESTYIPTGCSIILFHCFWLSPWWYVCIFELEFKGLEMVNLDTQGSSFQ